MPRESAFDKAGRYLLEGRIILRHVDRTLVHAVVRGDGALYRTRWEAGARSCSCPHAATTTDCSHVIALKRITAVDLEGAR